MKSAIIGIGAVTGFWSGFAMPSAPERILMICCFLAIVCDWFTGVAAAYMKGRPITSNRMRHGIYKVIGYFGLILISMTVAWVMTAMGIAIPQLPVLTAALGLIFATEGLSVIENIVDLTGMDISFLTRILKGSKFTGGTEETKEDQPRLTP